MTGPASQVGVRGGNACASFLAADPHLVAFGDHPPSFTGGGFSAVYLHSWPTRSRACASPLSENVSVDCVPLAETPFTTALWPARMASTICASSAAFLIQAPSCWV